MTTPIGITDYTDQDAFARGVIGFRDGFNGEDPELSGLFSELVQDIIDDRDQYPVRARNWQKDMQKWEGVEFVAHDRIYSALQPMDEWHSKWEDPTKENRHSGGQSTEDKAREVGAMARSKPWRTLVGTHIPTDASDTAQSGRVITAKAFFTASGAGGHYGRTPNVNIQDVDVSTPTALTSADWLLVLNAAINWFKAVESDQGEKLRPPVSNVIFVNATAHEPGYIERFQPALNATGGTNVYQNGGVRGRTMEFAFPDLAAGAVYAFNVSPGLPKPFFWVHQREWLNLYPGPQRVEWIEGRAHAEWGLGFGQPLTALKITLS
jgi:hypothetical protein